MAIPRVTLKSKTYPRGSKSFSLDYRFNGKRMRPNVSTLSDFTARPGGDRRSRRLTRCCFDLTAGLVGIDERSACGCSCCIGHKPAK
jgi:hypothetical protein